MTPLRRTAALEHEALVELVDDLDQRSDLSLDVGSADLPKSRHHALDRKELGCGDRERVPTRLEPLAVALAREIAQVLVVPGEAHAEWIAEDAITAPVVANPA